jgi:hypothetical protein
MRCVRNFVLLLLHATVVTKNTAFQRRNTDVDSLSLATTAGVFYILCTIFDALFPPFGLIAAVSPHSPWPLFGSSLGFLSGFVTFTVGGFVLVALYGIARDFWSKRLLAQWGIVLGPAVGAVLMSPSTVICAANARMLRLS